MKKIAKFVGIFVAAIGLILFSYVGYAFWHDNQDKKIAEAELSSLFGEIKIGMNYEKEVKLLAAKYERLKDNSFYWDQKSPNTIPRPPEFIDEKKFPNDYKEETGYIVIETCSEEAGSPLCAEGDEMKYLGLIVQKTIPDDDESFIVKEVFTMITTIKNGPTNILSRKSN